MSTNLQKFSFAFITYFIVCFGTVLFDVPFSYISFIAPVAGITTALVIFIGVKVFFATIASVVFFAVFIAVYYQLDISLAMVIITLLAIMLQSYWAKQITLTHVNNQKWLKSRRYLLVFLFKIGPLTSLVCASTIVVIAMLDNKVLAGNLLYTFFNSWSESVLFSIFFTPIFLLTQRRQPLAGSKRFFIIVASSLAFVAISLLFKISQDVQSHDRQYMFSQVKNIIQHSINNEMSLVVDKLISLSAYTQASDEITLAEFNLYSKQISHQDSAIRALEWAPIIKHAQRGEYEKKHTLIKEKSNTTILTTAAERDFYAPIHYVYPYIDNKIMLGYDVLTNSREVISMDDAINNQGIIASGPINLIQDNHSNPGILFVSAVYANPGETVNFTTNIDAPEENLLGFVVIVAQFEDFFKRLSTLATDSLDLFIEDVSATDSHILFGKPFNANNRYVEQLTLDIYSRHWRISLIEKHPWQMQSENWQTWVMLFGATFGGVLFQLLILMMGVYSTELSYQVVRKTRELIIEKDQSVKESIAKTHFIHRLNKELQTPLQAIKVFSEQLGKVEAAAQPAIIKHISEAQKNISKLLNMVVDLSKIESGDLAIQFEPFDFHGFIARIEMMLKAQYVNSHKVITLLIDPSVPHFIMGDELRIQQFLMALCENIHELYASDNMRLTIKARGHNNNKATLLFIFTNQSEYIETKAPFVDYIGQDISQYSTQMAMAKEVCQLMAGNVSLGITDSQDNILTAVIKVTQTSNEQQYAYQAQTFDNNIKNE